MLSVCGFLFLNYSSGPANSGQRVTGAPFDNGTCGNCHGGGSYGATATLQLLDAGNNVVSSYIPGSNYTLRISRSAAGLPANGGFGFQLTAATTPGNLNNNTWGISLPTNVAKRTSNGRQYIEQSSKISAAVTSLDIPWSAPATNIGSLKFYLALNTVNGNFSTGGDQVVTTSLTVTPSPLSVTWKYFNGVAQPNGNLLQWGVAAEENVAFYTIERSEDGREFSPVGVVSCNHSDQAENHYSYLDVEHWNNAYYRVSHTELSGTASYFRTIQVNRNDDAGSRVAAWYNGTSVQMTIVAPTPGTGSYIMSSIGGEIVAAQEINFQAGTSVLNMPKPTTPGVYLVSLRSGGRLIYHEKIVIAD